MSHKKSRLRATIYYRIILWVEIMNDEGKDARYIGRYTYVRQIFVLGYQFRFSSILQWYIVEYHYIIKMHVFGVGTYLFYTKREPW